MFREQCRIGMVIEFGRQNGEMTKGTIIKLNPKMAKVQTLESRGSGRGGHAGAVWNVAYGLMRPATDSSVSLPPIPTPPVASGIVGRLDHAEELILEAIAATYSQLSPENLTCDGELPRHVWMRNKSKFETRLNNLFKSFGRAVSETEVYDWIDQKRKEKQAV